jgi:hypothetical protein
MAFVRRLGLRGSLGCRLERVQALRRRLIKLQLQPFAEQLRDRSVERLLHAGHGPARSWLEAPQMDRSNSPRASRPPKRTWPIDALDCGDEPRRTGFPAKDVPFATGPLSVTASTSGFHVGHFSTSARTSHRTSGLAETLDLPSRKDWRPPVWVHTLGIHRDRACLPTSAHSRGITAILEHRRTCGRCAPSVRRRPG